MDNDFQTTFIPKKPLESSMPQQQAPIRRNPVTGIFTMVGVLLFVLAGIAAGGTYMYDNMLVTSIAEQEKQLKLAEDRIEQGFIVELQNLDKRLRNAQGLLAQHISLSPLFTLIEENTLKSIQYDSFEFSFEEGQPVALLTGRAKQYRAIAEQSVTFGENSLIESHVFSNFALTQKGQVSFSLKIIPSNDLLYFEKSLGRVASTQNVPSSTQSLPVLPSGSGSVVPLSDNPSVN